MQFVRQSKFRHVYCKPLKREFCVEDVRVTAITWDSLFCAVNTKFIAVIVQGSGGPFTVIPISKTGRIDKDYPIVDAHRGPCLDVCWCPFNDNVIASCSEDCTAKIWHIPDGGLTKSLKTPIVELLGHQKRVSSIVWHPTANNVLLTAGADLKIFLWNVGTAEALIEIDGHPDLIWSVDFNYNGSKIVTTCKDKQIRIIDPRSGRILQQAVGHEGVKPQRAIFLKDGKIFTTGFTKRSERVYALREENNLDVPIVSDELDTSNGVLFPLYDPDTGLLYLCGKGDSNVRYYEVNDDPPFVHFINVYGTSEPQRGIGFMPKRGLNVNENEIARIYKCTNKGLIDVLKFFVPRKSELFQDDLYPDTKSAVPALSADEWMGGKDADPILVSVRPDKQTSEKVKATIVKKSNILTNDLSSSQSSSSQQPVSMRRTAPRDEHQTTSRVSSQHLDIVAPANSGGGSSSGEISPVSPRGAKKPALTPRIDDDMGIMDYSKMSQQQQQHSQAADDSSIATRSNRFSHHEDAPPTGRSAQNRASYHQTSAGKTTNDVQRRPAGDLAASNGNSSDHSVLSRSSSCDPQQIEELVKEIQRLKTLVRGHDRRIKCLEDRLNERESKVFDD
uniref:Coronin n=1 Tax=Romanomermis culicivorax TaxID=13658 RepID=A0A915ITI8_ROMCU